MKTFRVTLTKREYYETTVVFNAENVGEAYHKAMIEANNTTFENPTVNYSANNITETNGVELEEFLKSRDK